jgi:hypothetical protein
VAVVDGERRVYAVRPAGPLSVGEESFVTFTLGNGPSVSAPFNVLDAAQEGLTWWHAETGVPADIPLHIVWQEGEVLGCGTCYEDSDLPKTIYLYGVARDNDALDDPVILHELGHFLQTNYSHEDSPMGPHDGTPTDPRLAWAEGWATAFSSMVRGDPAWFDTRGSSRTFVDLETPDPDYGFFTGEDVTDPISEYLVAAVLYDLWDDVNDGADVISLGGDAVRPLLEHLMGGERAERGVPGVDFVDYLDGGYCLPIAPAADLNARISEAQFPYNPGRAVCHKPSPPMTVGENFIVAHRRLDGVDVRWCPSGCVTILSTGPLNPGERLSFDVAPPFEVIARRGHAQWVALSGFGATPTTPRWRLGPPTHGGRAVIEVFTSTE